MISPFLATASISTSLACSRKRLTTTGCFFEVGCLGEDARSALLTAMLSTGNTIPKKNILISSGNGKQKAALLDAAKYLRENGYNIYATEGTYRHLVENGMKSEHDSCGKLYKIYFQNLADERKTS